MRRGIKAGYNFASLFTSRDLGALEPFADRVLVMENLKVVAEAAHDEILDQPRHDCVKRLLSTLPSSGACCPQGLGVSIV
jgi:ABC-type glutathione transport system ATPase component